MPQPVLYIFAISHYCEKARWALDHYGIAYRLHPTMPGMNRKIAKRLGSNAGSMPFLQIGDNLITGSSAIIDWGEHNRHDDRASLNGEDPEQVSAIEKRLDDIVGVHIRRYYYSAALLTAPASVRPIFSDGLPFVQKMMVMLGWKKIVPVMIKLMDLGLEQGAQSRDILGSELDWLDALLSDGRPYLTGNAFTRADITAASLLAPLINPPKHPTYKALQIPSELHDDMAIWRERPIIRWVNKMYTAHR